MAQIKMSLNKNAKTILDHHFLRRNEKGETVEVPEQLFRRVAQTVALADGKYRHKKFLSKLLDKHDKNECDYHLIASHREFKDHIRGDRIIKETEEKFFDMLSSLDFLPNSPTLFNAGKGHQQLIGSFVLQVSDDVESIFTAVQRSALLHQSGAGTGFNFSSLRPTNDLVRGTNGIASGPVSFMRIFDSATEQMRRGGKRRGANAAVLRVDHPDIVEFINAKQRGQFLNFNLFVGVTEKFMKAVEKGFKINLINPRTGKTVEKVDAKDLFGSLCESIRKTGSPGVVFLDEIAKRNTTPRAGHAEAISPGGDVPLLADEGCALGSINLAHMVKDKSIDWERLKTVVWTATHFLDNTLDMSNFTQDEIFTAIQGNRRIGLGVMGFADMLAQLRVRYNSDKGIKLARELMEFVNDQSKQASVVLAKERGVFPNFRKSTYGKKKEDRVRNATRTAIAPTSTISIIAGCSPGIEPLYGVAFHYSFLGHRLEEVNKYFVEAIKEEGVHTPELVAKVKRQGNLKGMFIPAWTKRIFVTASSVQTDWHLKMQAAFQEHCDNDVAKVVPFKSDVTADDIKEAIKQAYVLKCKSMMVHRYGLQQQHALAFGLRQAVYSENECPTCEIKMEREGNIETCKKCGYGIVD